MSQSQGWREALLDFLFPPRCAGCGRGGSWLCPHCIEAIERIKPPLCHRCGLPSTEDPCWDCQVAPLTLEGIRGIGYLRGPLQKAIHRFKYSRCRPLAVPLAQLMHQYLLENPLPLEVIVPVPLYQGRVRERGYNQAALLARELGQEIGLPVEESLVRVRDTAPQVGLPASQRRENVRNAFLCQGLEKKRVLLIDDVCTTGATLEACAVALREGGAQSVWALVLARER